MAPIKHADDILNINVGGKKYTVRRSDLMADPRSKLADWFRPNNNRPLATDKGGNIYLNRDPKTFRHILSYLRLKKNASYRLSHFPRNRTIWQSEEVENLKTFDHFRLVGECEALNLVELKESALEVLQKYQRTDEIHYVTAYTQSAIKDYEAWQFEKEQTFKQQERSGSPQNDVLTTAYDEWANM